MKNDKSLKNRTLKKKVKELILKSKSQGLIKPHTEAFKNNPVFKIVNDYENRYAFLLSYFINPPFHLTL